MPTNFPTKTAFAFTTALAALALYRAYDKTKGLSPAIFPEATHFTLLRHQPAASAPQQAATTPLNGIQQTQPATTTAPNGAKADGTPCPIVGIAPSHGARPNRAPISPYLIDDCGTLDPFLASLNALERYPAATQDGKPRVVTILHYGDSPTTADLITGDIRELLQQRFGDAGRGFLLSAKPWAWYQHRGVDLADKNWQISTAVGKGRPEVYGIGGASFQGDSTATTHITLKDPTQTSIEISYQAQPTSAPITVSANGTQIDNLNTADPTPHPMWHTTQLPPQTRTIDLHPTGPVRLFGETLLTGHPGVLYDSLGLNGASTSVLSNGFNAEAWQAELRHTQPALVIINYGTNESSYAPYVDKLYEGTLRTAIARIRTALPGVPILVMSPMDRGRRAGVDQIETYDTIPRIIAIERRVAADLNCAFFDTFDAMGGDGTMSRWYTGHPRLVAGDLIHPTPQGAAIVAHLFVHDLSLAYDRYLGHQPTQSSTKPVAAFTAPTPNPPHNLSSFAEGSAAGVGGEPASRPANTSAPAMAEPKSSDPIPRPKPSAAGEPVPAPPPTAPTPELAQPPPS